MAHGIDSVNSLPKIWTVCTINAPAFIRTRASEPQQLLETVVYSRPGVYKNTGLEAQALSHVIILGIPYANVYSFVISD